MGRDPVERLTELPDGQIMYEFRNSWHDGTKALVLTPMELVEKLAALVPPPRQHQLHYHGIFSPRAKWRSLVVPGCPSPRKSRRGGRCCLAWAELLKKVFKIDILKCSECGGLMKVISTINPWQVDVIEKILTALGLPTQAPQPAPARDPPQQSFDWEEAG